MISVQGSVTHLMMRTTAVLSCGPLAASVILLAHISVRALRVTIDHQGLYGQQDHHSLLEHLGQSEDVKQEVRM